MFGTFKLGEQKLRHELELDRVTLRAEREKFELQKKIDRLTADDSVVRDLGYANDKIKSLEADIKIEKARSATIVAEQRSSYAEHVMAITDERVKEMRSTYEGYAKNITEIVKAANAGDVKVNTSVNSNS